MNTEYPPDYSVFTKEAYFRPPAKLHRYLTFITVWTFCSRDKDREIITMARGWCWGVEIMALFSSGSSDDLQRRFSSLIFRHLQDLLSNVWFIIHFSVIVIA